MRHSFVLSLVATVGLMACGSNRPRSAPVDASPRPPIDFGFPEEHVDLAPPVDLSPEPEAEPDLAPSPVPLGCSGVVFCADDCQNDAVCRAACLARATIDARRLLNAIVVCISGDPNGGVPGACPNFGGGICDRKAPGFDSMLCDQCVLDSQAEQGACFDPVFACELNCEDAAECRLDPRARCVNHICTL